MKDDRKHRRDAPRLSGRFQFLTPSLVFPRLKLYRDRLVLTGWGIRGRFRKKIALQRVLDVDAAASNRLIIWLSNGRALRLRLANAQRWKSEIEMILGD